MGFTWACVGRSLSTFLSDSDEKVFLCPLEDVKGEMLDVKRMMLCDERK